MINKAKVVSAFDGMACGMLAMMEAGIEVERYVLAVAEIAALVVMVRGWRKDRRVVDGKAD